MKTEIKKESEGCQIILSGELDHHSAREAIVLINEYLDMNLPKNAYFELMHLSFMDSSGIAVILGVHKRMSGMGGNVVVKNVQKQPARVLNTAGLGRIVTIIPAI